MSVCVGSYFPSTPTSLSSLHNKRLESSVNSLFLLYVPRIILEQFSKIHKVEEVLQER